MKRIVSVIPLVAAALILVVSGSAFGATYYVPDNFSSIQAALNGVANGDTILVRNNVYTGANNKNLDFKNKSITLRSVGGAANCIIDCQNVGRGFYLHGGGGRAAVIDGFTIRNADITAVPADGGGLYCSDYSLTIANCRIISNRADSRGAGIYCIYSSLTLIDSIVSNNGTGAVHGGAFFADSSTVTITDCSFTGNSAVSCGALDFVNSTGQVTGCTISDNSAGASGGGVGSTGSDLTFENCDITENWSSSSGGGFACHSTSLTITDCEIDNNVANLHTGGGIYFYFYGATPTLTVIDSSITGNTAGSYGGGIYFDSPAASSLTGCRIANNSSNAGRGGGIHWEYGPGTFTNCEITGNYSTINGGGIYCDDADSLAITHCTIADNTADNRGGGLFNYYSPATVIDSILWGDSATDGAEIALVTSQFTSSLDISYSDVEGGEAAAYVESGCTSSWGDGNIDSDPLFVGGGNYHLTDGSPCIDAGIDAGVYTDIDGDGRPEQAGYDMGSDERLLTLAQIWLQSPEDHAVISSAPTFSWTLSGGTNNAYIVDFLIVGHPPIRSTPVLHAPTWTMPDTAWNRIKSGSSVIWRVRGADLDDPPLTIITSDEVRWFSKP